MLEHRFQLNIFYLYICDRVYSIAAHLKTLKINNFVCYREFFQIFFLSFMRLFYDSRYILLATKSLTSVYFRFVRNFFLFCCCSCLLLSVFICSRLNSHFKKIIYICAPDNGLFIPQKAKFLSFLLPLVSCVFFRSFAISYWCIKMMCFFVFILFR